MHREINKAKAIKYVVIVLGILVFLGVWPTGLIKRPHTSMSEEISAGNSLTVYADNQIMQLFGSEGDRIQEIEVAVSGAYPGSLLRFVLYDEEMTKLLEREVTVDKETVENGFVSFKLGYNLEKGASYFMQFMIPDDKYWMSREEYYSSYVSFDLEDHYLTTATANSYVTTSAEEYESRNLIVRYKYLIKANTIQTIIVFAIILVLVLISVFLIIPRLVKKDSVITVHSLVKAICNPLIIIVSAVLLINIYPIRLFGNKWYDIAFNYFSVLLLDVILLYYVNYKRAGNSAFINIKKLIANIPVYARVVAIAHVLWWGFTYANGLYEIFHTYAYRRFLIAFLIVIITTYKKEELLNLYNLIWFIGGGIYAVFYAYPHKDEIEAGLTYKLEAYIIVLGGIVALNMIATIVRLIRGKIKPLYKCNLMVFIPMVIFFAGMCILSNTRGWPYFLTVYCALLLFRMIFWDGTERFNRDLTDGVLLNFIMMVVFSLLHRPYYGYRLHRYSLGFHTVTVTAIYLTLILAAVMVKLFYLNRVITDKRQLIPHIMLGGMAMNYMLFTLSRTGYLSTIIMVVVSLFTISLVYDKRGSGIKNTFIRIAELLIIMAVMFPVTFTMTRLIPIIAEDPEVYEFEHSAITMYEGTPKDCEYYMNIYRFGQVFGSKVLGVGTTTTDAGDYYIPDWDKKPENGLLATADFTKGILLTSIEEIANEDPMENFSNGRLSIFRSYISQSNMWGHEIMGAILEDGSTATHAHNTFLQAIFDHGWVYGIYFSLFLVYIWIVSVVSLIKRDKGYEYNLLFAVGLCGLMSAGLVEWVFHPCYSICAVCMMSMMKLALKRKN